MLNAIRNMWTIFLSIRYFLAKRKEGIIAFIGYVSVIGVALGVAALIIVISVMNGFDREVKKKIIGTYAHLMITESGGIAEPESVMARAKSIPEVEAEAPFIIGQAVLRKDKRVTGILLKGVDPARESMVTEVMAYTRKEGRLLADKTIILGSELMKEFGIAPGDTVELFIPYSIVDIESRKFKVIGSFTSGRYDYDSNIAVLDIKTAQDLLRMGSAVTGVGLKVSDAMKVTAVKAELQKVFRYPYIVKSWMDLDKNLVRALAIEKKMMFLILALIVMVACFNISSSLVMMVMEKTRDIGILKALGASSWGVSSVFFLQGAVIGLIGILVGGVSGVFIANRVDKVTDFIGRFTGIELFPNDVYYFTRIPVEINPQDVVMIVVVAMVLTLLSGIYPAIKASRLDPVEAIRYE